MSPAYIFLLVAGTEILCEIRHGRNSHLDGFLAVSFSSEPVSLFMKLGFPVRRTFAGVFDFLEDMSQILVAPHFCQ
jgi:hypothetical protein